LPSPPSHDIPSTSQVQSLPPQQPQSSPQDPPQGAEFLTHLFQQVLDTCSALTRRVENLEHDKAAQKLEIIKLKARVKRLERANKVKSSKLRRLKKVGTSQRIKYSNDIKDVFNQGRMIDDLDKDEGIELRLLLLLLLKLVLPVQLFLLPSIPAAAPTVVAAYTRRRKGVIIKDLEEELSSKTPDETLKLKDKGKGILIETPKPMKKKGQIELNAEYARKLHEKINKDHEEINKDIDWDAAIDHVKQKSKENPQFDANMRFLDKSREEMEEEDREVVNDEDDDVFTKATPLARKTMFEKPDGQDDVWKSQRSIHGLALVKRWKLLTSCGVHIISLTTIQLILLVERRYLLLKFTLEQLMNVTRLQIEEESEMSLELLRFTRQQLQEYQQG
nr:hypothetical protein [Tanacetum cinerariifolium]